MSGKYTRIFGSRPTGVQMNDLTTFALCAGLLLGLVIGAGVARLAGWGSW